MKREKRSRRVGATRFMSSRFEPIIIAMEIRPLTPADLKMLDEIDATVESTQYLHVERSGEAMNVSLKIESRPLREKRITRNPMSDDVAMELRQITSGADEGLALAV